MLKASKDTKRKHKKHTLKYADLRLQFRPLLVRVHFMRIKKGPVLWPMVAVEGTTERSLGINLAALQALVSGSRKSFISSWSQGWLKS